MAIFEKIKTYYSSKSKRSQIVAKNAAGSLGIKCLSMAVDFAKVPVLLTFLDTNYYGVFITIASIVAWTHQFDFGLGTGLRYKLTEAISLKNEERAKQLVSTAYISMSAIMSIVLLVGTLIVLNLSGPTSLIVTLLKLTN